MNLLQQYKSNKDVKISSHNGLNILKYNSLGADWANELTRQARGLVIDDNGEVVARPFDKFFNLNELTGRDKYTADIQKLSEADQGDIEVTDKLDGSLVIAFNHNNKGLQFASSGSLDSYHSELFAECVKSIWDKQTYNEVENLAKTYTMMFEYISENNKIVLDYDGENMKLIGLRRTDNGQEFTLEEAKEITKNCKLEYVDTLPLTNLDEVMDYINHISNIEGVVVLFKDTMKRVKIKTEEYMYKHSQSRLFELKADGLTYKNIKFLEDKMFSNEEGLLDDLASKFTNKPKFAETLRDVELRKSGIIKFKEDLEHLAFHFDRYYEQVEGLSFRDNINSKEIVYIDGVSIPVVLILVINRELESFHKSQEELKLILDTIKSTKFSKLGKVVSDEVGIVSNYNSLISVKSFIFQVIEEQNVWTVIKGSSMYNNSNLK